MKRFFKRNYIYFILITIIIVGCLLMFKIYSIKDNTMNPLYNIDDSFLINKLNYLISKPMTKDVVLINKNNSLYIRRIIGTPKDDVYVNNGIIYINGLPLLEDYVGNHKTMDFNFNDVCYIKGCEGGVLPDDYYLVMGDNREGSIDSRNHEFGLVNIKDIKGKALLRLMPVDKVIVVK
ncbi:MAG: signal peptidase I [Bacilli bacterium]